MSQEQCIRAICADVLRRPGSKLRMGRSFVAHGGDSLLAIQMVARCSEQGYTLTIHDILEATSLRQLCEAAQVQGSETEPDTNSDKGTDNDTGSSGSSEKGLDSDLLTRAQMNYPSLEIQDVFPCSPIQETFLVAQALDPRMYQCSAVVRIEAIDGVLSTTKLNDAWVELEKRHAALRTIFIESVDRPGHFDQMVLSPGRSEIRHVNEDLKERRSIILPHEETHRVFLHQDSASSAVLRLEMSHALTDGLSIQILVRDLCQGYGNVTNLHSYLPPYQDTVSYTQKAPGVTSFTEQADYLAGAEPSFFPIAAGAPNHRQGYGTVRLAIKGCNLERHCRQHNATVANLCQLAWALVLRAYTGSDDVSFSYAVSGRAVPLRGIHDAVGSFANAIICRLKIPTALTVAQAVAQAKRFYQEILQSHQQQGVLSKEAVRLRGNSVMSFRRKAQDLFEGCGMRAEILDETNPTEFDLALYIASNPSEIDVAFDFWHSHISETTVQRIAASFEQALLSLVDEKTENMGATTVVPQSDIERIRQSNQVVPPRLQKLVQDRVHEHQCLQPDAWAVQGWDGNLTYRQLEETANKLALYLVQQGVKPESKIALCFEKSQWAVISQLAVLKAGGCVVPVGPTQPIQRVESILNQIEAEIVLTSSKCAGRFEKLQLRVVVVNEQFVSALPACQTAPVCQATPENAAFVIFTSGSTGIPKGVVLPHSSLCTSLHYLGERFGFGPHTRKVQFAVYTFDASIQDIYTTWHYGGCVCIPGEEELLDDLGASMRRYNVNTAGFTSTVAGLLFPDEVPELHTLILFGEAVKPVVVERWLNHVKVLNAYGPSECSMSTTCKELTPGCNALNIGTGCAGVVWVVEAQDYNRLVPIGAPGELLIEGPLQARGYLHDECKTAAAFVTDPTWALRNGFGSGRRFYRTGDIGQQNEDMTITYIGRRDTQIKVRGQRVEIGEIEYHLAQHNAVLDAAVVYPRQGPCPDHLVGVVALHDSISDLSPGLELNPVQSDDLPRAKKQTDVISQYLASCVPEHMVPTIWIPITSRMPQNASTKLDRKRLTQWVEELEQCVFDRINGAGHDGRKSRDAETEMEMTIQQVWAAVLNRQTVQIPIEASSFLALGGDSMAAMQVVAKLRSSGINIPMREVLKSESIAQLATVAEKSQHSSSTLQSPVTGGRQQSLQSILASLPEDVLPQAGIGPGQVEDIYSCSPIQEGILMSQLKTPFQYYSQQSQEIKSSTSDSINVGRLMEAWQGLIDRHPILRTIFVVSPKAGHNPFLQVVLKSCKANIKHISCSGEEVNSHISAKIGVDASVFESQLGHRFLVFSTPSGRVYTQLIMNHALMDATSHSILQQELAEAYDGNVSVETTPLYKNYISYLEEAPADGGIEYWSHRLANAQPCYLPASTTITHPREGGKEVIAQDVSVDIEDMEELYRFSRQYGVTIATMFQVAWAMVLSIFTGSLDVSFGYLSSGRDVPVKGAHRIVGPMINMMVTNLTLDPTMNALNTIRQAQDTFLDGLDHQRVPLPKIWHALQLHGQSLFNTVLSYRSGLHREHSNSTLSFEHIHHDDNTEYDVCVNIFASPAKTNVTLQYSPVFMDSEMGHRLVRCMQQALRTLAANPGLLINQIPVVTPEDTKQICRWQEQTPTFEDQLCIHDLVHRQRVLHPNATAIVAWDGTFTYEELGEHSDRLAHHLQSSGVGPEVTVALCFDKSIWAIVAQLGVLKAGGVVVSVNPQHPDERLCGILDDASVHLMLTTSRYRKRFSEIMPKVVEVGPGFFHHECEDIHLAPSNVRPDNAAFIIFTSGSTGKPKGVVLTHSGLCVDLQAQGKAWPVNRGSRLVQFAAYTFDVSTSDIWVTLIHGGCICVISEEERMNNLEAAMESYQVNLAQLTPTVAGLLDLSKLPSLETMVLGGEPVKAAMIERWLAANSRVTVIEGYGPCECSIYASANVVRDPSQAPDIGRPLLGSLWLVVHESTLCPIGAVGEIWIEGPSLARGYLNDQYKTETSFITDPLWARHIPALKGRRFYRTGDLARQTATGNFLHCGRKDTQIKIRGQRVEIGEIEHHVKKHLPSVKDAVVIPVIPEGTARNFTLAVVMEMNDGRQGAEVFLRPDPGRRKGFGDLRDALTNALPLYMVPRLFVPAARLPHNPSGKLDRRALRLLLETMPENELWQYGLDDVNKILPVTDTEKQLQKLWATILEIHTDRIGLNDHFLHVGGDSLTAMRLVALAQKNRLVLTVSDVFQYPRLQDMAAHVETQGLQYQSLDDVPRFSLWKDRSVDALAEIATQCGVTVDGIEDIYPCTPLQEGLMAITAQTAGAYVGQWVYRLGSSVSVSRFKQSYQRLVKLLPILRTRIVTGHRSGALQVVVVDESIACEGGHDLDVYLAKGISHSMTYGQPLVQAAVIENAAGYSYFVLTAHHSMYDGVSLDKTIEALSQLYIAGEIKTPPPYNRFLRYIQHQDSSALESFWRSQLDGDTRAPFPTLPEPSYQPHPTQLITARLEEIVVPNAVTLASLLRGAWALVVSSYTEGDVLFGEVLSGRAAPVAEIMDMLAPTITTVPVRVAIEKAQKISKYLAAIQQQAIDLLPFEHTGLQHIRRLVQKDVSPPHLFSILPVDRSDSIKNNILELSFGQPPAQVVDNIALVVQCTTDAANRVVDIEAQFDEKVITLLQGQRLLDRFKHIFFQLVEKAISDQLIGHIEMISREEVTQLADWNRQPPPLQQLLVHEVVSRYAASHPEAPAICSWDGDLTHGEMDRLAETLGHHLVSLGVGPEIMVGLCFDKSKWAIISILAILKAGGAVVPLRAEQTQRGQAILASTGIDVVLTTPRPEAQFIDHVAHVLVVDETLLESLSAHSQSIRSSVTPRNTAFVYHTSGSTGVPKGVVLEHAAIATSVDAQGAIIGMNAHSRSYQFSNLTFDLFMHDILTALQFGGCVCVPSEQERFTNLAGAINRMQANKICLTPRVLQTLRPSDVPSVRTVIVAGEALQAEQIGPWVHTVDRVINGYGPTECSMLSTAHTITDKADASTIGTAIAGTLWVVDPHDHNRLLPIGAIGELLIGGPQLAREYLHQPDKTASTFISNPSWMTRYDLSSGCNGDRRLYRTGDLVRQRDDGSLVYIGRADSQIKIRGQRAEIGEIEHYLLQHEAVQDGIALLPRRGPSKSRLVGVLVLRDFVSASDNGIQPLTPDQLPEALEQAACIRAYMISCLPDYMVPDVWLPLTSMPHSASNKADRTLLMAWLEGIDSDVFDRITGANFGSASKPPASQLEQKLQAVCADVLCLSLSKVEMNRSFLNLGGDSITAMQVVSELGVHGFTVAVREVLQSRSLAELATKAVATKKTQSADVTDAPFDLSPIQRLYFESFASDGLKVSGENRFNQSLCLEVNGEIEVNHLHRASKALVERHAMLRSRFSQTPSGLKQRILPSNPNTFHFEVHYVRNTEETENLISSAESHLNIEQGPVFAVHWINVERNKTRLFLVAHHLVVDIVSWHIILRDLEALIRRTPMNSPTTSFQRWTSMLQEHSQEYTISSTLPSSAPVMKWDYWGLTPANNVYGNRHGEQLVLDEKHTSLLFSDHQPLHTEPVEILIAALFHSFRKVFPNRQVPTVFNEGHGREPWDDSIDLSGTVGWFTTMMPIYVALENEEHDVIDILRKTKDTRRRVPERGLAYFSSRWLTPSGRDEWQSHDHPEVVFNYHGREMQSHGPHSLFTPVTDRSPSCLGKELRRMSVFEIEVSARDGCVYIDLYYSRLMQQQHAVRSWGRQYLASLQQLLERLSECPLTYTVSDFPRASLTDSDLSILQTKHLPQAGIRCFSEVEDIYPCAPIQQGILIGQIKDCNNYHIRQVGEIVSQETHVSVDRLAVAWHAVVARHAILRTTFFASSSGQDIFYQMVRKQLLPDIPKLHCNTADDVLAIFDQAGRAEYPDGYPQHRFCICETMTQQVFIQLEINHALTDASSSNIILRDLFQAYSNMPNKITAPSYGDYVFFLQQTPSEKSLAFWRSLLTDASPCHFPSSPTISTSRVFKHVVADFQEIDRLQAFRDEHGVTIATILQLVWGIVLSKYSMSSDVVFGSVASGRDVPIPSIDAMAGPTINLTIARMQLDTDVTVSQMAKVLQHQFFEALQNQRTSLAEIQHVLQLPDRGLFNTTVSYKREEMETHGRHSAMSFRHIAATDPNEYDLNVHFISGQDRMTLALQYASTFVDEEGAQRILDVLQAALRSTLDNGNTPVSQIETISPSDIEKLRVWNSNIPNTAETFVHEQILEHRITNPTAVALRGWEGQLTYRNLNRQVERLAQHLTTLGVQEESTVGLCFDKSMWTTVAMLAVLRAGGVIVPLGTQLPLQRLQHLVEDSKPVVILTDEKHHDQFLAFQVPHILTITAASILRLAPVTKGLPRPALSPWSAAVIIYTSGSTGKPKGVVLTHGSLSTSIEHHGSLLSIGPTTRVAQFAAYVFDMSLAETLTVLQFGGTVCVISEEDRKDSQRLSASMERMGVNMAILTPTVAALLKPENLPSLRTLLLGGEKLPPAVVQMWAPHVTVLNGYGPAECTIVSTLTGPLTDKSRSSNVGWTIAGALWVVDPRNADILVPIGAVGELLIEGPLLARGYLNDSKKTESAFITQPGFLSRYSFEPQRDRRMYRTGDLVQQDPVDGSFTVIGRADDQVKINGQRIELGEVEYWVQHHHERAQKTAATLFQPEGYTSPMLAVVIELPDQETEELLPVTESLRASFLHVRDTLGRTLPSYMVPSFYLPVGKLPLTTSGKLDRKLLGALLHRLRPDQLHQYALSDTVHVEPSTATECRLRDLWENLLPTAGHVSANAHFFRSGGDSVTAMRLVGLATQLQPPLPFMVADIFAHPVLSAMAHLVDQRLAQDSRNAGEPDPEPFSLWSAPTPRLAVLATECNVNVNQIEDVCPCTPLQEGLMAITSRQPQAYINRWVFRLEKSVNIEEFDRALQYIYNVNPILRTRIVQVSDDSGLLQVSIRQKMRCMHITSDLASFLADDASQQMGLGTSLSRFAIVNDNSQRYFIWTAHHAVYDGWCVKRQLETAFQIYSGNSVPDFVPYTRFIRYLQRHSTIETAQYWQSQLLGAEHAHSFPPAPKNYTPTLSHKLARQIPVNSAATAITTATLLRCTWAFLLSHETGSQHVVFPTIMSGRSAPVIGIMDIMGPTIATVPVHMYLDREQKLIDYLRMAQRQATDMIPFEHTGLQKIRAIAPNLPSAFQHLFVVQPSTDNRPDHVFPGLRLVPTQAPEFSGYPLVVICSTNTEAQNYIELDFEFDPRLLSVEKVQSLLQLFEHVFIQLQTTVIENTNGNLGTVSLLTPSDIELLREWNHCDSPVALRANMCIHELVEEQAIVRPDAPAVCSWDAKFSFHQLDQLATRLAHHLVSLGVVPEVAVGIMFEKSAWAVVSELAILKSGGIVVPMNPRHPKQRIQTILRTTGACIILSSSTFNNLDASLVVDQTLLDSLSDKQGPACPSIASHNAAFIIFTSGSTGTPKGVVLEHGSLVSNIQTYGPLYASPATRTLQFASYTFDASIGEIFATLSFGGCVCVPSENDRMNRLAGVINDTGANFVKLTPTVASLLRTKDVPSLKTILMMGEALKPEAVLPWLNNSIEILNGYGPSECSISATLRRVTDANQSSTLGNVMIGAGWVVDASDYQQLVPIGSIGELLIEGPLLSRGYLNDEAKTSAAFVIDPSWSQVAELGGRRGRRFYRTGDLVRQNLDGSLVYVGRQDTQVKINGQRVETGEIEHWVKAKHPDVHEVVANLVNTDAGTVLAVAMELSKQSSTLSGLLPFSDSLRQSFAQLRCDLQTILPGYMVPQIYLPFSRMPVTDSGKLDRRATWAAVQQCSLSDYSLQHGTVKIPPSTPTERYLRDLWAAVLRIPAETIGANDDFFHAGADSISAMRLVTKARAKGHLSLEVTDIFRSPILSEMATIADERKPVTEKIVSTPYRPYSSIQSGRNIKDLLASVTAQIASPGVVVDAAPITDMQAYSVASSLCKSRDALAYVSFDANGMPDIDRWKSSCLKLIRSHEILRTAYVYDQDQLVQVVLKEYRPEIPVFNARKVGLEEFTNQLIAEDMHCPPRLGQPFVRFAIVSSEQELQHRIIFRVSHGEYDRIALSYFIETLQTIYNDQPVSEYTPFTHYVSQLAQANKDESREYWRSLLRNSSMPGLSTESKTDPQRGGKHIVHGSKHITVTPGVLPTGITLSIVVHAAWALVLSRCVDTSDVMYGDVVSGRSGIELGDRAAGCCANIVPFRAKIDTTCTPADWFRQLQDQMLLRLPHETLGTRDILRSCTDLPPSTFFTSRLNHITKMPELLCTMGSMDYRISLALPDGACDLPAISVFSTALPDNGLEIAMGYRQDLMHPERVKTLSDDLYSIVDVLLDRSHYQSPLDAILPPKPSYKINADDWGEGNDVPDNEEETAAPKFQGDLIDATYRAFLLRQQGVYVTADDFFK